METVPLAPLRTALRRLIKWHYGHFAVESCAPCALCPVPYALSRLWKMLLQQTTWLHYSTRRTWPGQHTSTEKKCLKCTLGAVFQLLFLRLASGVRSSWCFMLLLLRFLWRKTLSNCVSRLSTSTTIQPSSHSINFKRALCGEYFKLLYIWLLCV